MVVSNPHSVKNNWYKRQWSVKDKNLHAAHLFINYIELDVNEGRL